MGNNRNLSIDLIKIIAMLSVVGLHSTCDFINPEKFGMANILYRTFVVAIPLFFMVSGFLLLGRKNINYRGVL